MCVVVCGGVVGGWGGGRGGEGGGVGGVAKFFIFGSENIVFLVFFSLREILVNTLIKVVVVDEVVVFIGSEQLARQEFLQYFASELFEHFS